MSTTQAANEATRPHPTTNSNKDPNLQAVVLPEGPLVIKVDQKQLEKMFGEDAGQMQESVEGLETQLIEIGKHSHLLERDQYNSWKRYIISSAKQLNQATIDESSKNFRQKFESMKARLNTLEAFFNYERSQGLIAVHSDSGVRIYRKMDVGGEVQTWLVTPDQKSFSDVEANRIQEFVKCVTGVTLSHPAIFQRQRQANGRMLLSCRIDRLDLKADSKKHYEYQLNTQMRTSSGFDLSGQTTIRFTKNQIDKGEVVIDIERGFGYDEKWPQIVVQIIPFGMELKDLNLPVTHPSDVTPIKTKTNSTAEKTARTVADVVTTRISIPTKPARINLTPKPLPAGRISAGRIADYFSKRPRFANFMRRSTLGQRLLPRTFGLGGAHGPVYGPTLPPAARIVAFFDKHRRLRSFMQRTRLGQRLFPKVFGAGYPHGPYGPVGPPVAAGARVVAFFDKHIRLKSIMQRTKLGQKMFPKIFGVGAPHGPYGPVGPPAPPAGSGRLATYLNKHQKLTKFLSKTRIGNVLMPKTFQPTIVTPPQADRMGRVSQYLQNKPRLTRFLAKMVQHKIVPNGFSSAGPVAAQLTPGTPGATKFGPPEPSRWRRFKLKHPQLSTAPNLAKVNNGLQRVLGNNAAKATYYTAALVGIHNFCSGRYEDDQEHSYLPSLLRGGTTEKALREWGVVTRFNTSNVGVLPAWGVNTATTGGDLAIIVGGGKLTQMTLARLANVKYLRVLPFGMASKGVGLGMKGLGKVAGVAYAPYAGYSYFRDGQFIEGSDADLNKRVGGTVVEGFAAGFMVGGPWGGVAGVALSSVGAFTGAMGALGDTIEDGHRKDYNVGVRRTLKRGAEGWLLPDSAPDNEVPSEAQEYIDRVARTEFLREAIKIKNRYGVGSDIPFSSRNWSENFSELDDFLEELDDYRHGRYKYVGVEALGVKWHAEEWHPLEDTPNSAKRALLSKYKQIFESSKGTKRQLTRLYERSWQVTSYPGMKRKNSNTWTKNNLSAWDTFWGEDKDYGFKAVVRDDISSLTESYQSRGFARREQKLRAQIKAGEIDYDHPSVAKLAQEEAEYLHQTFPNLSRIISTEEGQSQVNSFTSLKSIGGVLDAMGNPTKHSEIMNSFAIEMLAGPTVFRMKQLAIEYKESGLAAQEAELRVKLKTSELSMQSPEVRELLDQQREFLHKRVPNFFNLIAAKKGQDRMNQWARTENEFTQDSSLMSSFAVEAHFGSQKELQEFMAQTKDPEFQTRVLAALEGQDKEDLRLHFANKNILEAERYASLVEKAAGILIAQLEEQHGESPSPKRIEEKFSVEELSTIDLMQTQEVKDKIFRFINESERAILTEFWQSKATKGAEEALEIIERALEALEKAEDNEKVAANYMSLRKSPSLDSSLFELKLPAL